MSRSFIYRIGGTGTTLTQSEQDNNILCIMDELEGRYGWSRAAVAGACGCFHEESNFNPGIYETSHGGNLSNLPYFPGGMGLAQWTDYPAYQGSYPNPLPWAAARDNADWYDGVFQCYLLTKCQDPTYTAMGYGQGPRWGWQTSPSYPSTSFANYVAGNMTVAQATTYWFYDFEWHWYQVPAGYIESRIQWAEYAYSVMEGETPEPPGPGPDPGPDPPGPGPMTQKRKMPLWMYLKRPFY